MLILARILCLRRIIQGNLPRFSCTFFVLFNFYWFLVFQIQSYLYVIKVSLLQVTSWRKLFIWCFGIGLSRCFVLFIFLTKVNKEFNILFKNYLILHRLYSRKTPPNLSGCILDPKSKIFEDGLFSYKNHSERSGKMLPVQKNLKFFRGGS